MSSAHWPLIEWRESARRFHGRDVPLPATPAVWWNRLDGPALVLGSTQRDPSVVDAEACRRAGVDVVRRRSGGGAVLLEPDAVTWIDVVVPVGAPGWGDDVHTPMRWLGHHLASVIRELLGGEGGGIDVHDGPLVSTPWSSLVCFDGIGPGELTRDGIKLVGISQRRTRDVARLQCAWYSRYDVDVLAGLLADEVRPPAGALGSVATLHEVAGDLVVRGLVARLDAELGARSGATGGPAG